MSWTSYESNPWSGIDTNKRDWYVPALYDIFTQQSMFAPFVTTQFSLGDVRTETMHITSLIPPHPDFSERSSRNMWLDSSYMDSRERRITFKTYQGKLSLHELDDLTTYWQLNGPRAGLLNVIQRGLGHMMVRVIDLLARNSFLSSPFALYGSGSGTKFDTVEAVDTITTEKIDKIRLGMAYRGVPFANNGVNALAPYNTIFCITSPGVTHDLRQESSQYSKSNDWLNVMSYADPMRVANGEVGLYHNVRFIESPDCVLWNCGDILAQTTVTAAIANGDGAPNPASTTVDDVFYTGQPDATHYITVASATGFSVGDEVTIHKTRTSTFGVTNGVDYREGTAVKRRIVAISSLQITFDLPITTPFTTDLGSGVYAYLTRGRHIHASIFIGGMDAVVMGVLQPPQVVVPPTVDDTMSMQRVAWKGRFGYTVFEPASMEVLFTSGTNRIIGDSYID